MNIVELINKITVKDHLKIGFVPAYSGNLKIIIQGQKLKTELEVQPDILNEHRLCVLIQDAAELVH